MSNKQRKYLCLFGILSKNWLPRNYLLTLDISYFMGWGRIWLPKADIGHFCQNIKCSINQLFFILQQGSKNKSWDDFHALQQLLKVFCSEMARKKFNFSQCACLVLFREVLDCNSVNIDPSVYHSVHWWLTHGHHILLVVLATHLIWPCKVA